jgi:hypothetical protein|tara:strand:- start:891 stop:1361 length:471 start_codon:yes stop_codon:yes gene_type:complete
MFWGKKNNDNYSTPVEYLSIINNFIPTDSIICDPFYNDGLVVNEWKKLNRDIIHLQTDFFDTKYECDIFVSNPPFSSINKILKKLFELDKPFALLIPIQKIAQLKVQLLLKDKNIQLVVCNIYIGFIKDGERTRCPSQYFAWVCYRMDLPRDLVFI